MKFPSGLDEIKRIYGDPTPLIKPDGRVDEAKWQPILGYVNLPEPLKLGWVDFAVGRIRVHHKLVPSVTFILGEIHRKGWWYKLKTFDGSYSWRPKRGHGKLSTHSWGIALDFNAATNRLGTVGDIHPGLVEIFKAHGWEWGGDWKRKDCMHFQACYDY